MRKAVHSLGEGPDARETAFDAIAEAAPERYLEVGCGEGKLVERVRRSWAARVVALDQSERMVELTQARVWTRDSATFRSLRFQTRSSTAPPPLGCSTTSPT